MRLLRDRQGNSGASYPGVRGPFRMKTSSWLWIVVFAGCLLGVASGASAELERLVGNYGETIGYLDRRGDRTFVKDRCFQTMGYTTKEGTFTDTGIRKAQSPLPSMLLESERNCAKRK